jgi:hypothetical protein
MKLNRMTTLTILFAASLLAQAQQQGAPSPHAGKSGTDLILESLSLSKPVERVNGTVLTQQDLLREMYAIFPYARQHNGFPKAMEADIREGALKMITFEELVYQEAQRRKMTVTPGRLAAAETQFRKQFGTQQQYKSFLAAEAAGSPQILRQRIKRSLLIEDLLKLEVTNKSAVTLAEVRAFYSKNSERLREPELYTLQTITIMPPRPADPRQKPVPPTPEQLKQMRARADEALKQAKATKTSEEFGVLAERISEDDYRVMMGSHHPTTPDQLPPEVVKAASTLQPGQISAVIQAEGAYTIIRVNAHTPPKKQDFDKISKALRTQLQKQKSEDLRHALDARLRKNARIEQL